jgi:DNA-binding transcriptional ArsR family regulator
MHLSDRLDRLFQALSDETRRDILLRLSAGRQTARELARPFEMSQAAVSKHLKKLEKVELVERTIRGRQHYFSLNPEPLKQVSRYVEFYRQFWRDDFKDVGSLLKDI